MRVFILTTGRSGSTTFAAACSHITNYTSGHETRNFLAKLDFPNAHIEVNNRLAWLLPMLARKYPSAHYCYLERDHEMTARSFVRWSVRHGDHPGQLFHAYRTALKMGAVRRSPIEDARDLVDLVQTTIREFLLTKTNVSRVRLEHAELDFPAFFDAIRAWGDLRAALEEFQTVRNRSQ